MNCRNCEDSGYQWDSLIPCHKCSKGAAIAHIQDEEELSRLLHLVKALRQKIKQYENLKGITNKQSVKLKDLERA